MYPKTGIENIVFERWKQKRMDNVTKITGGRGYVKFDIENGYIMKAEGEMIIDNILAYTNTIKS